MTDREHTTRRTVLQTLPATVIGGGLATGLTSATRAATNRTANGGATDVEVTAKHDHEADEHRFELSTTELTSGWTSLTFENRTDHTHFAYLSKLPRAAIEAANEENAELRDFYNEHVTRPFQWFMDNLDPEREPNPDDLSDKYSKPEEDVFFPPWFQNVVPSGGAGLTSGHMTSRTTLELDPGEYILECYVKNDEGKFHSYLGMLEHLTVTENRAGTEPEATLDLSLSTGGIAVDESVRAGEQTVGVRIEDQQLYDHQLGHDVHLIRFDATTMPADVNGWMNWMDPEQLVSDGTEPGTFLGGVKAIVTPELLEGAATETAYFDVTVSPGAYAWVAEVPQPAGKGMLQPFIVPFN